MPSRFITLFSIAIFLAIIILTVHYIEYHKKKDKKLTVTKITLVCQHCNHADTYYNIDVDKLVELYPCHNDTCSCKGQSRKVTEYIK